MRAYAAGGLAALIVAAVEPLPLVAGHVLVVPGLSRAPAAERPHTLRDLPRSAAPRAGQDRAAAVRADGGADLATRRRARASAASAEARTAPAESALPAAGFAAAVSSSSAQREHRHAMAAGCTRCAGAEQAHSMLERAQMDSRIQCSGHTVLRGRIRGRPRQMAGQVGAVGGAVDAPQLRKRPRRLLRVVMDLFLQT